MSKDLQQPDKRLAKILFRYWSFVSIIIMDKSEPLATMSKLKAAIFEYKEYSRAECILDGLYQKYNNKNLSPF